SKEWGACGRPVVSKNAGFRGRKIIVATQTKPEPCSTQDEGVLQKEFRHSGLLRIVAVIAIVAMGILILAGLFAPGLRYSLVEPPAGPLDAPTFVNELES